MNNSGLFIFGLIVVIIIILSFLDERKTGLWQIVRGCKQGRARLAIKRLAILFVVSIVIECLLLVSTVLLAIYDYGGVEVLGLNAQSVSEWRSFTYPITVLQGLCIYGLLSGLAVFVLGLIIWSIVSVIHNRNVAVIVCVFLLGIEFALYNIIDSHSIFAIIKYVNLFCFLFPAELMTNYINYPLGNQVINLFNSTFVWIGLLIVVFSFITIVVNAKMFPFYQSGWLEMNVQRMFDFTKKILCRLSGFGFECYKLLFKQKGIIVILLFGYLIFTMISQTELLTSPGRELTNEFYKEHTGPIKDADLSKYEKLQQDIIQASEELLSAQNSGNDDELYVATEKLESYAASKIMLSNIEKQKKYGKQLDARGISAWFIDYRGYNKLLGKGNEIYRLVGGILAALSLILICSSLFTSEWGSKVAYIIRCTQKGRKVFFFRKCITVFLVTVIISGLLFMGEIIRMNDYYSINGFSAPIQNIPCFKNVSFSMNIGTFLILWFLLRFIILWTVSMICMMVSTYSQRVDRVYFISLFLLPLGLLSSASEFMVTGHHRKLITLMVGLLCIALILISLFMSCKRWVNQDKGGRYHVGNKESI